MLGSSEKTKFLTFICELDAIIELQEDLDAADDMVVYSAYLS